MENINNIDWEILNIQEESETNNELEQNVKILEEVQEKVQEVDNVVKDILLEPMMDLSESVPKETDCKSPTCLGFERILVISNSELLFTKL